jgi:hypothetical protein
MRVRCLRIPLGEGLVLALEERRGVGVFGIVDGDECDEKEV